MAVLTPPPQAERESLAAQVQATLKARTHDFQRVGSDRFAEAEPG